LKRVVQQFYLADYHLPEGAPISTPSLVPSPKSSTRGFADEGWGSPLSLGTTVSLSPLRPTTIESKTEWSFAFA
jgi:hypothetical protein